jgi:CrcB protein
VTSGLVEALMVAAGGAVGAPLRYLTDQAVQARHDSLVPWGTVVVNVVGSFVLGAVTGLVLVTDAPHWVLLLVGTGGCGALTTFSTFGYETVQLLREGAWRYALGYVAVSLVVGLAACTAGWTLAWWLP